VRGNASGASHRPGSSRPISRLWQKTAKPRISSLCSTRPLSAPPSRRLGQKGAGNPSAWTFTRGFSTKIHAKTDLDGLPLAFALTGGEASDSRHLQTLLDIGPDIEPRPVVADKGYDAKANREVARARGIAPAIPLRKTTKLQPAFFPKILYKTRARIEILLGKPKRFKRIALRCEKTARNYASFVALARAFIWDKSVHPA
jgi:transposase